MKIAVPRERAHGELRVAASPDSVKKLIALGAEVAVEAGAGECSGIRDADYREAGAAIHKDLPACLKGADIVLAVQPPEAETLAAMPEGATLIGLLNPSGDKEGVKRYAAKKLTAFAMELLPRISRAQSMDALSSQSNLAGYRAVIEAAHAFGKAFPMMMTAAGTVAPAKVLVLGAGVAGLQAIATAKRLGAAVSAFDVRPAVKEQVESLGAKFVEVPAEAADAETRGGYAKEMSEEYKRRQSALIHETLKRTDIAISTALIPGKPAPVLIAAEMVKDMKPGSVIVDLAVAAGGNCPLSQADRIVTEYGVIIVGCTNLPARVAADASQLYARNLYNFVANMWDKEKKALAINREDEIVKGALLTEGGVVVHEMARGKQ